jgi:hypothetical protein
MDARYSRQLVLPGFGADGQRRLGAARVLVVGAGGLGSSVIPLLAGAGVGAYSARGSLPLRFELRGGKSLMYQTAAAVLSEGGVEAAKFKLKTR